jgi:signal transduction histidine kinase
MIEDGGNTLCLLLDSAPTAARVDGSQLKKVIDAILENAAQHTVNGAITVGSGRILRSGRDYFTVSIEDTGSGIAPDLLPSIMESFAMTSSSSGGRYGGTGLSLTVASKLCQVMGGHIDVNSRVGRGSRFTAIFPLDADQADLAQEPEPKRVSA